MSTVKLVGPIVEWASSLLLLGVFVLLIPLGSQRRAVLIWMTAWATKVVATTWPALTSMAMLLWPRQPRPEGFGVFQSLFWPARAVFLATVAVGSLTAAGRRATPRTERLVPLLAALLGFALAFGRQDVLAGRLDLVATPLVFFGCAQIILMNATGSRQRGLTFLGVALALFGTQSTLYLMSRFAWGSTTTWGRFLAAVDGSSGYGDAIGLAVLSAAVIVVIVQESFLDATTAQADRLRDVAASESRLNGIIQAAREAIITADADGRIDLLNGAAAELFRLRPGEALGKPLKSFIPDVALASPAGDPAPATAGASSHATLTTQLGHGRRMDGSTFPVEFTVGRLPAADRPGYVLVLRDLTTRRAIEAEREAFGRRMAESEKMLAIGRVVSGVAHELNNPLAVVLGQSEQLVESAPSGEVQSGLRLIHEQAYRARHIVRDLLAFVRHREERPESVSLVALAERTAASQLDTAMTHAVTLLTDLPADVPLVRIDRVAVEQILVNLVDNGLDAAGPDGSVRISVRSIDGRVELAVEDSGHGVPVEIAGRIFEPFFTTKGPGHGTGLGLSVSRELAEQQGGTLRLENRPEPGIGARFVLALPAAGPEAVEPAPAAAGTFPAPPLRGDGKVAEAMLIDDEPAVRTTLGRMFARGGWRVREADSGESALAWLLTVTDADMPAVILCDLKMPGMSGHDVYGQLVMHRPALVPRLIFVTGDVVESTSNGFIAASGRDVVEKPFTIAEIAGAVERVVRPT